MDRHTLINSELILKKFIFNQSQIKFEEIYNYTTIDLPPGT
jgi:hypothetical protein